MVDLGVGGVSYEGEGVGCPRKGGALTQICSFLQSPEPASRLLESQFSPTHIKSKCLSGILSCLSPTTYSPDKPESGPCS